MNYSFKPGNVFVIQKRRNNLLQIDKNEFRSYFLSKKYKGSINIQAFLIDEFGKEYRIINYVNVKLDEWKLHRNTSFTNKNRYSGIKTLKIIYLFTPR